MENIWIGRRSSLEVEKRYIDKFDNDQDPKVFNEALSFMGEFVKLTGTGMEVIEGAKAILTAHGISTKFLENLKDIVAMLDSIPLSGKIALEWIWDLHLVCRITQGWFFRLQLMGKTALLFALEVGTMV